MLHQLLTNTAQKYPKRTALVYGGVRLTWQDIESAVSGLTTGLAEAGIGNGDRVALWVQNSPIFVISFFAILSRGGIVVLLNPASQSGDIAMRDERLHAVITTIKLEAHCRRSLAALTSSPAYLVCPDADNYLHWDLVRSKQTASYSGSLAQPAIMQFSSGSTGQPKALYRTHGQCLAEIQQFGRTCDISDTDVIFCAIPLFHSHGLANTLWAAINSGATLVLMRNPQPFFLHVARAVELLVNESVTIFPAVPYIFEALTNASSGSKLPDLRLCFSAGAPLSKNIFNAFNFKFGVMVRQLYGCTEAGAVTINLAQDVSETSRAVGAALLNVDIEIRDESGTAVMSEEIGDIWLRSPSLTSGYLDDDNLNSTYFNDNWFMTGDVGHMTAGGVLTVVGRKAFVIHVAGHKVYANEIEAVLCENEGVKEAAVVGVAGKYTEEISAFVVTDGALLESELKAYSKQQLPSFKQPMHFNFVDSLPKTTTGKLIRSQLK